MERESSIEILAVLIFGSLLIYGVWDANKEIGARVRIENMLIDAGVINRSSALTYFYLANLSDLTTEKMLKHLYDHGYLTEAQYQYWLKEYQRSLETERGFGLLFVFIFLGWSGYTYLRYKMKEEKAKEEVR